jgi:hypothetical protein
MRGWLVLLVITTACSSGTPVHPRPEPSHDGSAAERPVDDGECATLVAHAIDLRIAEQRAIPDAGVATEADRQQVRDQVQATLGADCRKLSRTMFHCALAATTTTALVSCENK